MTDEAVLWTVNDVAARLGLSRRTIFRLKDAGTLPPPIMLGARLMRWNSHTIETWIAAGCPRARKAG